MRSAIRLLSDLAPGFVLAPERHVALAGAGEGIPLGDLAEERRETIDPSELPDAVILDTSHARDGLLDVAGALRDGAGGRSPKKRAYAGDVVVSRLRPYLRQVAFVHPDALSGARPIALSTEFYVLSPRGAGSLAFLLPFLLSDATQAHLAAAQEGGHHPRVPRSSLLAMRVPESLVANRAESSRAITKALVAYYRSLMSLRALW